MAKNRCRVSITIENSFENTDIFFQNLQVCKWIFHNGNDGKKSDIAD